MGPDDAVPARIADYEIVRLLAEGNYGRFYLARPPGRLGLPDEYVVVKVFTGRHGEQAYRRGVRELRAFAEVASPHLVRIHDAVLQEDFLYAVEYCPLGSLAAPARRLGRAEVLRAVASAARAAQALHEAGLTHGDIQPATIWLTDDGGKLADLGLARYAAPPLTVPGTGGASLEYLDPALLRGEPPSPATDVFALGATLHRVLTGSGLYADLPDDDPVRAARRVLAGHLRLSAGLSLDEAALVRSCTGPAGARPTALEAAERLDGLAADAG